MPTTARTRADACPGVVSPHLAADGALARVRLPGGLIDAPALRAVAALARDAGDGAVHLTSRGNLQLRGLDPDDARPVRYLAGAGLLPSRLHERVRNVLASPLSGISGGYADVRGLAAALDRGLCARPDLAALPGRFLIAIDDGRGDVAGERPDLCWRARSTGDGELLVAGDGTGLVCGPGAAPDLLLDAAAAFLDLRGGHTGDPAARVWRAAELPDAAARIAHALRSAQHRAAPHRVSRECAPEDTRVTLDDAPTGATHRVSRERSADSTCVTLDDAPAEAPGDAAQDAPVRGRAATHPVSRERSTESTCVTLDDAPAGVGALGGGAVGAAPVLGELSAAQLELLAGLAPELLVTPWRTLVLPDPVPGALDALRAAGLVVEPGDPALRVSACAGRPGCAKSLADVRTDARALIALAPARPVHVAGCARRCGAPHAPHTDAVATGPQRYEIDGTPGPLRPAAPTPTPTPHDRPRSSR
ncbi:precorrin-3B synthase [Pseudonocardia ammonioxydans]|uniref:precorrin-3B synthase n=1 Tax=Pseudonocardia ammonioxydans TaxID=260086 RepID=UPI0031833084